VGGAAPNPGLPVEMEDYLDVGELAEPVGGSLVQDRGVQDQQRHYSAPVVLAEGRRHTHLGPARACRAPSPRVPGVPQPGTMNTAPGEPRRARN